MYSRKKVLIVNYFFKILLILKYVISKTITNHKIIQINCGIIIKISLNFAKSELGHILKSSIINKTLANHKNCRSIESSLVFSAININPQANNNKITLEKIELNQKIATKIIANAIVKITFSDNFLLVIQI